MSKEEHKTITVTVQSTRGSRELTFSQETKISEVISKAVTEFGFAPGDRFELVLAETQEALKPERTLVSYKIEDKTVLILTSVGGGV